jgi:6-pyruvoyltetrahydropterin/6-carboxytetrahydropterin synthase
MDFEIPKHIEQLGTDIQRHELKYHSKRVAVTKTFTFDAAHHLHCYEGKCKNLHGHTYKLVITISGFVNETGLAVDFQDIKQIYNEAIKSRLDHRYLNEVLPKMNTTAENMIVWIWEAVDYQLNEKGLKAEGHRLEELVLFETPTSYATLKREWVEADD